MVLEIHFWSVNYTLVAMICKNKQRIMQKQYTLGFKVNKTFESHSTQQNIIFQHRYQSYCHYLLKMGHMDEDQAVFEQLTLSGFKKWSSTALKAHSQV